MYQPLWGDNSLGPQQNSPKKLGDWDLIQSKKPEIHFIVPALTPRHYVQRIGSLEDSMHEDPSILIVDDDPDILDGILMILESQDYRLRTARDGVMCLELLAEETPNLLILDLLMPRMDGWGVIREVRSNPNFADMPIMILTTVIEDASRRRYELETGYSMDIQAYIEKPAKPNELINQVEKLLQWKI